jgi:diguanylate cyclase (GGDEF)-like protein
MQEEAAIVETFSNELLVRYRKMLSQIEDLEHADINRLAKEISAELPPHETKLHHLLLNEIVKLNEKIKHMLWVSEHLKILHDLAHTFTKTFDEEQILWKAFELVSRVMRTDAFFIAFYDENDSQIRIPISIDNGVDYGPYTIPFGSGYVSRVIETKQTIHLRTHQESYASSYVRWGDPENDTNTCIFVPMLLGNQVKGVISAQSYQEFAYKQEHEELLKIIGFQVASAIETARLYDKVYQMSIKDELTNIKNYRAFHHDLERILAAGGQEVTLIMLDSDNLKAVNDQFGHHMGDELIRKVAEAMMACMSPNDSAYRYAGDEFMILSVNTSREQAEQKVAQIMEYLRNHPLRHEEQEIAVSVSVGVACYPEHADGADALKRAADEALYQSKKKGKNSITFYQKNDCV